MGIMSGYIDNQTSNISSLYEGVNTNAYDMGSLPGSDMSTTDIAMLPLKYSFKLNMARQAWNSSRTLGITSSLKDPFSASSYTRRRSNAYKQFQFRGLIGDILESTSHIGNKDGAYQTWARSTKDAWNTNIVKDRVALGKAGFIEKRILGVDSFHKSMSKLNPDYLAAFHGSEEEAFDAFTKNTLNAHARHKTLSGDALEFMDKRAGNQWKRKRVTPWSILTNKEGGDLLGPGSVTDFRNPTRKHFTLGLFGPRKSTNRTAAAATEGLRETYAQSMAGMEGVESFSESFVGPLPKGRERGKIVKSVADLKHDSSIINNFGNGPANRLGFLRKLKVAMWVGGIATVALPLAAAGLRTYMEVPTRLSSTLDKLNRMDFGSGEMLQNNSIATERQRALVAIRDGQLNARSIMGNEAAFMH